MRLPAQIPPQSYAFGQVRDGALFVDVDWYLFLFNMASQTISTNGTVPAPQSDMLDMIDLDAIGTDLPQAYRAIKNIAAMLPEDDTNTNLLQVIRQLSSYVQMLQMDPDAGPSLREVANSLVLALDTLQQDPVPQAQPAKSVTVGASPFTYIASFDGTLSVTAGTVSGISIIRQSATVATGMTSGLVPLRRGDQVQITYTAVPTVVFLPA